MKLFNARNVAVRITTVDSKSVFNVTNVKTCCIKSVVRKTETLQNKNLKMHDFLLKNVLKHSRTFEQSVRNITGDTLLFLTLSYDVYFSTLY